MRGLNRGPGVQSHAFSDHLMPGTGLDAFSCAGGAMGREMRFFFIQACDFAGRLSVIGAFQAVRGIAHGLERGAFVERV